MLDKGDMNRICKEVDNYWRQVLGKSNKDFFSMATGKEGGHQLGDKVDQLTTSFIHSQYPTQSGFQHNKGGASVRGIGDIWFKNKKNEWNPINVKTGLVGSEGQPNIVSIKRILHSIFEHKIDSYYLLLVKFSLDLNAKCIAHQVYLVDMLDWLGEDVITFDAGPGQTMLRAKRFFDLLFQKHIPRNATIREKMESLMTLYLLGEKKLIQNRRHDRKTIKSRYIQFMDDANNFRIDLMSQKEFDIR